MCREYDPPATDAALPLVRCEESGGLLGDLTDGWASPVGGEAADEPGQVADAAGRVDIPAQGLHRPGGQGGGVVDLGLAAHVAATGWTQALCRATLPWEDLDLATLPSPPLCYRCVIGAAAEVPNSQSGTS